MSKQRSRRLRKKLHLGEFQELGFLFDATLKEGVDEHALLEAFLAEALEPNQLDFDGWINCGSVETFGHGRVTEEQRQLALNWLAARPEILTLTATGLIDLWYSTLEAATYSPIKG